MENNKDNLQSVEIDENLTDTEVTESQSELSTEKEEDVFVYLNRIITSVLSGVISLGMVFIAKIFVDSIFGQEALMSLQTAPLVLFTILVSLCLTLGFSLQNYFVRLIEKTQYLNLSASILKDFIWQILLVTAFIPVMLFTKVSQIDNLYWVGGIYMLSTGLIALITKENDKPDKILAGVFGLILGSLVWLSFSFQVYASSNPIWIYFYCFSLIIQAFLSEVCIAVSDLIKGYFKD